ncbi:hypothetical protein VP1G_10929 [Cytospora mali]|uniref:Uncharacterized protein n=1 Tax=Cytospora mali TaxID=578113 RepID=A0A194V1C5_CYTMA|nr:hypothetical protein VP1G_10929 [Valsa mali var. pyri (nom. inval.)]
MHKVVESNAVLEEVVDTTHDAEDTEGEDPDTDNGDNGGLASTNEPSEDTEQTGNNVDDEDSTAQLPRGDRRPERTVGTGDEDQPVLSQGDLEEDDLINVTEVLDNTTVDTTGVHGGDRDPGTDSEDNSEQDGHSPELGQVPLDRRLAEGSVVIRNSQSSNIGENGNEDDQLDVQGSVENGNPETKVDLQVDGQGDTVDNVGVHAVENLARSLQGVDDSTKTGGKEDNVGGGAGSIGGTLDSNTSISLLQGGSVVDTVTSHGNKVTTLLENLDDVVLVLGEDLSETIGSLNEIVNLRTGHVTTATETETLSVVDVGTKTELAGSLTSDTDGITSQHLDGQTQGLGLVDGLSSVVTGRVGAGHDTQDLPGTLTTLASNTKRTETTGSELSDLVLVGLVDLLGDGVVLLDRLEDEERSTLDASNTLALGRLNDSGNLLGDRVEGVESDDLVLGEDRLGAGVVLQGLEEGLVDGVNTLLLAGSSQASSKHEVLGLNTGDGVGLSQRQLVLGQGTGLVRAEDLDTSQRLDSGQLLDDGLLLGEVGSTDSHGGGNDSGKTDGDTNDGDGQGKAQDLDDGVGAVEAGNPDDEKGEDDQNQEHCADTVQDLSEVTRAGVGSVDKCGGTTDEGVVTSGGNNDEGLTTLDSGGSEALVALVLVDSQRLTSDGGLVNLQESILGDNATISGNDRTVLNLENITGNDLGSLKLLQGTVTKDNSLQGESLLEFVDNATSLEFLDETNTGVKQKQGTDDTEINPILKTSSQDSSSLHDELDRTDEVHEELQNQVLLLLLHLVETILLAAGGNLSLSETSAGILWLFRNDTATSLVALLVFLIQTVSILGLKILDQGVDVLIFLVIDLGLGVVGGLSSLTLLVEAARLDLRVQRRRAVFGHCGMLF